MTSRTKNRNTTESVSRVNKYFAFHLKSVHCDTRMLISDSSFSSLRAAGTKRCRDRSLLVQEWALPLTDGVDDWDLSHSGMPEVDCFLSTELSWLDTC